MANALFDNYKEIMLTPDGTAGGEVDLGPTGDTIKVALIDTDTVDPDVAVHDFYDDISAAVVGTPVALANKTITDGTFDADDVTFTAVAGAESEALVIYKDSGAAGTSALIALIDTGVTGLPVTPSGGDIVIAWNASGIFAL